MITAHYLGRIDYLKAHALQEALQAARIKHRIEDTLLLLEHPPVITRGRTGKETDILTPTSQLSAHEIALVETGRGGEVTLHAPGQLVAYPIFDLRPDRCDVRRFVRDLGAVMIRLGAEVELGGAPLDLRMQEAPYIGVWANRLSPNDFDAGAPEARVKLGAIGVRLSHWVTMHGFAFNASTDLSLYRHIVPCGIRELGVGSLASLGVERVPSVRELAERAVVHFGEVFGGDTRWASEAETEALLGGGAEHEGHAEGE